MHAQSMVKQMALHISLVPRLLRPERGNEPGDEAICTSSAGNCYQKRWCTGVQHMALIDWKAASGSADDVSHYTPSGKQLGPLHGAIGKSLLCLYCVQYICFVQ